MNWIKSSACESSGCVEVAFDPCGHPEDSHGYMVAVRNSHIPGEIVWFTGDEWTAFCDGVRNAEFDA